ncbi:hypothetical protein GOV13_02735 [Candidatus Pacearchaeota archaeon]|nr:hypothetical protein [Candidatus Pacearchaeota archaeon]
MKIASWMELPVIAGFMIGKKAIVHAKMAYGRIEKHAYVVSPEGRLKIHADQADSSKKMYNPQIKGNPMIDSKGRLVFRWDESNPDYAYSLFDATSFDERKNYDDLLEQTYNAGMAMGALKSRGGGRKSLLSDPIFLALGALLLLVIFSMVVNYLGLSSLGAKFVGGTAGSVSV